jgi:hypothetical protein
MFASPNRAIGKHMLYPVSMQDEGYEIYLPHRIGRLANICYILPGGSTGPVSVQDLQTKNTN